MKKWLLFLAIAIAVSIWTLAGSRENRLRTGAKRSSPSSSVFSKQATLTTLSLSSPGVFPGKTPIEVTENFLLQHRKEWNLQPYHRLEAQQFLTPLGTSVNYQVTQDGIPIVGMSIRFRLDRFLRIVEVENEYRALEKADLNEANLPVTKVVRQTETDYGLVSLDLPNSTSEQEQGDVESATHASSSTSEPVLPSHSAASETVLFAHPASMKPTVAYAIDMKEKKSRPRGVLVVVRASDGQLLARTYSRQF